MTDERVRRALQRYELAAFGGDPSGLDPAVLELDAVEAEVALARGRLAHARFFETRVEDPRELVAFEHALELYRRLGDTEGEALASFWVGCFHQIVRDAEQQAAPYLQHGYRTGGPLTRSYAARHLGFLALNAGDLVRAEALLAESVELRRAVGSPAELAAALLALAGQRAQAGQPAESALLLDEAEQLARSAAAAALLRHLAAARNELP